MQRAGGPGAPGGSSGVDEDMADGDLGDGTRTKPRTKSGLRTELGARRSHSCTGLCTKTDSLWSEGGQWRAGERWSHTQLQDMTRAGSLAEMSKEELVDRLQRATETIQVLEVELEVAHRYLQGKYAALKILQGQAILEKATSHTKSLEQKSEERAKALEKEVNVLQWELSLSQLRLRSSEQAFEKNFYRMLSERNSLSEALQQKELEKEQLRAENLALSAQYVELLSRVSPSSLYNTTAKAKQVREQPKGSTSTTASRLRSTERTPHSSRLPKHTVSPQSIYPLTKTHSQSSEHLPPD